MARVAGMVRKLRDTRLITGKPLHGATIPVEGASHVAGTLLFALRRGSVDGNEL